MDRTMVVLGKASQETKGGQQNFVDPNALGPEMKQP